jgi:3-oxoacyl-[acyl-carrier-protein] synthase II
VTVAPQVVVTGVGPATPVGTGVDAFWDALADGRSGIGRITQFDCDGFPIRIAGEVDDFQPEDYLDPRVVRRVERFATLAYAAAKLALDDAGAASADLEGSRVGVVVATAYAGAARLEREAKILAREGPKAVPPEISMSMMSNAAAALISIEMAFTGPVECTATACAASAHAISRGVEMIRSGEADLVLAGGADAAISPVPLAAFAAARALSVRNDDPEAASRPFDPDRDGYVFAEGATILVLESEESARARGARAHGRLLGHGHSGDAYSLAAPRPDGKGAAAAMMRALEMADVSPADVGYVNAHAASTPAGDAAEVTALRVVFGEDVPPTSSTKSMHGHMLGAAGATEAAATILALERGLLPPTINHDRDDPRCAIDVVPNEARVASPEVALTNSFGLGGVNGTLVIGRA